VVITDAADGRTLRRLRNEEKAVDAFLELVADGHIRPTAQQVAERSGVSIRSIFRLFDDVESLHAAAIARQGERVSVIQQPVLATGSVASRVEQLVDEMGAVYEAIAPVRRMAVRAAHASPAIAGGLARHRRMTRKQVRRTFEPELAALPAGDRNDVAEAIEAATSWETWDGLRTAQTLSVAGAKRVVRRLIAGLIT
jgi:AcrR family transcriptional regulator